MIKQTASSVWSVRWTLALALVVGALLSPYIWETVHTLYDKQNPVVNFNGTLLSRSDTEAVIRITGVKLRACVFVPGSTQAYSRIKGVLYSLEEEKLSPVAGSRPVGAADVGVWKVRPVLAGPQTILMFTQHDCDGRMVVSKIAEIELT